MRRPTPKEFSSIALSLFWAGALMAAEADPGLSATAQSGTPLAVSASVELAPLAATEAAPTPWPTPVAGAPATPGTPRGEFFVLTRTGAAPVPAVRLEWAAAEAGEYLVRGYRLYRAPGGSGRYLPRPENAGGLLGLSLEDPAQTGAVYDYRVQALDFKGQAGALSEVFSIDLRNLPADQLAPRAPANVSATTKRNSVLLQWEASPTWVAPVTTYVVYRAPAGAAPQPLSTVASLNFEDSTVVEKQSYVYAVAAKDEAGRVSIPSLTITGQSSGSVPPSAPKGLTSRAKVEKVTLSWSAAGPGTSPVSAYVLRRRPENGDSWKRVAFLGASSTGHTDTVDEADQGYIYSLAAVDAEGLTGTAAYVGASPTSKIWNKTLVILMPTAYANNRNSDRGVNLNVLFDFYVGSLYETYTNPTTKFTKNGLFQPLQIGTVTGDFKWSLLDDRGLIPGLAAGFYGSALIPFGNPSGGSNVGVSSAGGGISTLGNIYGVVSKRFWPSRPRAAIHGGLMLGKLSDYLTSDPTPKDWRPTLRHLTPGGDTPMLLNRFLDPKQGAVISQASNMAFAGIQVPFTLPLFFAEWKTGLRLEVLQPLPDSAEYIPDATTTSTLPPSELLPTMYNIHIDNLPLFGFEFSYFKFEGGYQIIAFYHIPDLSWSW